MSILGDKVKGFFNMDNMYDDDYDDYDDYDAYDAEEGTSSRASKPERRKQSYNSVKSRDYDEPELEEDEVPERNSRVSRKSSRQSKVVSMNGDRARNIKARIFTIKPTSLEDSKEIVDTLLEGKAIIINFEGTNTDLAQRIIDSISGACCAVDGTLKKVAGYIYLVAPASIELYGEYTDASASNSYEFKGSRYQY